MKTVGIICGVFLLFFVGFIVASVLADYHYSNEIQSYWDLSVKASTIQQKSVYLDKYVAALEVVRLAEYDAIWLKTPENNTAQNMVALKSLQGRMHEILGMDVGSFQYQQAMQQITAQEQDEAHSLLGRFEGAWYLEHHFFLWGWIGVLTGLFLGAGTVGFGIAFFVMLFD